MGALNHQHNVYDGHVTAEAREQIEDLTGTSAVALLVIGCGTDAPKPSKDDPKTREGQLAPIGVLDAVGHDGEAVKSQVRKTLEIWGDLKKQRQETLESPAKEDLDVRDKVEHRGTMTTPSGRLAHSEARSIPWPGSVVTGTLTGRLAAALLSCPGARDWP